MVLLLDSINFNDPPGIPIVHLPKRNLVQTNTRLSSPGATATPVIGHRPSPSSPSTASYPHFQQTTHPLGNTAGFCHFFPHTGQSPYVSLVTENELCLLLALTSDPCKAFTWPLGSAVSLVGGVIGGVGGSKPEDGKMDNGRGGRIFA